MAIYIIFGIITLQVSALIALIVSQSKTAKSLDELAKLLKK